MRILLIAALLLPFAAGAQAQTGTHTRGDTIKVENYASFKGGGTEKFHKWIYERIEYPRDAVKRNKTGRVTVDIIIDRKGRIRKKNITIIESPDPLLSEEVVQILRRSPRWKPGTQVMKLRNGTVIGKANPVPCRVRVPVHFGLTQPNLRGRQRQPQ
jgi:TonB family protein